ncbi:hypothetical protein [Bacillus massilinigeriensis]|uniref:hypothetical protein n=1 Tax=Bacillus mediterraneensis TaxID=1805474 RepID=UPI0008F7F938|nr:hypothetical protein [Bacillus mediterraneensis]
MSNHIEDKVYRELSEHVYGIREEARIIINGKSEFWTPVDKMSDPETGFDAVAYRNGDRIIIAYRGTEGGEIFGRGWEDIETDIYHVALKEDVWSGKKNQFTQSVAFAQSVRDKFPNLYISTTGHSLGGADAQFASAMLGLPGVGYSAPPVTDLLPQAIRQKVLDGEMDGKFVNFIHQKDPVGAGALKPWEQRHVGSTYAIGGMYSLENIDRGLLTRLQELTWHHSLERYKFDKHGNIKGKLFTNIQTGEEIYKSPRLIGSAEAGTIQITPEILLQKADELKHTIRRIEEEHEYAKGKLLSVSHISVAEHIELMLHHNMSEFINWYGESTTEFEHILRETAKLFVEADTLK